MEASHLPHAILRGCLITRSSSLVIVGSQALYAFLREEEIPQEVVLSREIDVYILSKDPARDEHQRSLLAGQGGEDSHYHALHGYYFDPVDPSLIILPRGWRERLQPITVANPEHPSHNGLKRELRGLCLDLHDLAVAKLAAYREKDVATVVALLEGGHLQEEKVLQRMGEVPPESLHAPDQLARGRGLLAEYRRLQGA